MDLEKGQQKLVKDLTELLAEVKAGMFGDFSNTVYVAPKTTLKEKLDKLSANVVNGRYD